MAQSNKVMAFRKRLKNRGYTQIRIQWIRPSEPNSLGTYLVEALEPLARMGVQVEMTLADMDRAMR